MIGQIVSREQLLSAELIDEIFGIENEVERQTAINNCAVAAKELHCKQEFIALVSAQKRALKAAKQIARREAQEHAAATVRTLTCLVGGENPQTYYTGRFLVDLNGISEFNADPEKGIRQISFYPIVLPCRFWHQQKKLFRVELNWWEHGSDPSQKTGKSIVVDRDNIASASKIVELAKLGFPVTSVNASGIVHYLSQLEALNKIPLQIITGKMGWTDDWQFVPYGEQVYFNDGVDGLSDAIRASGDRDTWLDAVKKIRASGRQEPLIYLAASFGSILLRLLHKLPFIVNIFGETGKGKTVALMLAASVWGDPGSHRFLIEANSTVNAIEGRLDALNDLPLLADDLSKVIIKPGESLQSFIYALCSGAGKSRKDRNLQERATATWQNAILTNRERPLADDSMQGGAINRVLDFQSREGDFFHSGRDVVGVITKHFGFAGPEFVSSIQDIVKADRASGKDTISDLDRSYEHQIRETRPWMNFSEKQVSALSVLLLADELSEKLLFMDGIRLDLDYCLSALKNISEISDGQRAFDYLHSQCLANSFRFKKNEYSAPNTEIWGGSEDEYLAFIPGKLAQILAGGGFALTGFLEWADTHNLILHEPGRAGFTKRVRKGTIPGVSSERPYCYFLKMSTTESESSVIRPFPGKTIAVGVTVEDGDPSEDVPFETCRNVANVAPQK